MPKCPDTIEEFQELERMLPLCKVTLYNQAKSRIESGAAKSVSEAARQLADETGQKPDTIRRAIRRVDEGGTLSHITGTEKFAPKPEPETKSEWIKETEKEILETAKKIKVEKAAAVTEKKKQAYQERVNAVKETKEIVPPNFILADPPWKYNFSETDARKIENHYDTEDVTCMVDHIPETQPNCILMMWATAPKLKEAFELMKLWKFSYKTCAVWDKEKIGMGYWFRGQHELLLVGVKGNVSPPLEDFRVSSVFRESRTEHSKKPECVYSWIEKAFADKVRLEMYCRNPRDGWQALGNEI